MTNGCGRYGAFSKSKLLSCLQCHKRLWLEIHRPDLKEDSAATLASFATGHSVGEVARRIYDPKGSGTTNDVGSLGVDGAIARTRELLAARRPIFEAGFRARGALAFADVLLPVRRNGLAQWRIVEVKSSTSVKDYQRDDAAVQAYVARESGLPLAALSIAHIDKEWVYPGDGDYRGLLVEVDMTREASARGRKVEEWIATARDVAARRREPAIATGLHCNDPFDCGFIAYCASQEPEPEHPAAWLPRIQSAALRELIHERRVREMGEVPDGLLNDLQHRVKRSTMRGSTYFDREGAAAALEPHGFPAYFLDFETVNFAVPTWKGMRPYQQVPFQFSLHRLGRTGKLEHHDFLDLSGGDPSKAFAEALLAVCGDGGPVYAYNAGFEGSVLEGLGDRFPKLRRPLMGIVSRMVDLLKVSRDCYYHPAQEGSWSIKAVAPTVAPDLDYDALEGVQHGGMAMQAFIEAIDPHTLRARRKVIERQLSDYCRLDTYAMVRLWQHFAGRHDLRL